MTASPTCGKATTDFKT